MSATSPWLLGRGLRGILRCDDAGVVTGIAGFVVAQRPALRLLSSLVERTRGTVVPSAVALVGGAASLLRVREPDDDGGGVAWVARFGNERRAIEPLAARLPELRWRELAFELPSLPAAAATLARSVRSWRRLARLARRLHGRHAFFKVLRAAELVGYYARYLRIFRARRFALAVTSNHSNPHGIAFTMAAWRCGVPVVLVAHGMPVRPVAPLAYDLAVVHGGAAAEAYAAEGCAMARLLAHGRRGELVAMPNGPLPGRPRVGVFLCKDVDAAVLRALVTRLRGDRRVGDVFVRPHPTNLWAGLDAWAAATPGVRVSRGTPVGSDLAAADVVLAGNSSVLVDAVVAGRPAAWVPGLDLAPPDLHGLVARGLVYPLGAGLDVDAMLRFYRRPEWAAVLRHFVNVEQTADEVLAEAGRVMRGLAEGEAGQRTTPSSHPPQSVARRLYRSGVTPA